MFQPEMELLFQDPTSETRLLRSARVIDASLGTFSIEFSSHVIELEEGDELIAFFLGSNQFMQQIVKVVELIEDDGQHFVDLEYIGEPVSAETREFYRATVLSADIAAELGEERDLTVQDVSSTGFAVVSANEFSIGTVLDVAINFEGDLYSGTASVQSIRAFSSKRIRYGMRALEGGDLADGLHQICMTVQRRQLKREAGSI